MTGAVVGREGFGGRVGLVGERLACAFAEEFGSDEHGDRGGGPVVDGAEDEVRGILDFRFWILDLQVGR